MVHTCNVSETCAITFPGPKSRIIVRPRAHVRFLGASTSIVTTIVFAVTVLDLDASLECRIES